MVVSIASQAQPMASQARAVASALLTIPLGDVAKAHDAMVQVEVAARLSQRVLRKSSQYGEDATLEGVRAVLVALTVSLGKL